MFKVGDKVLLINSRNRDLKNKVGIIIEIIKHLSITTYVISFPEILSEEDYILTGPEKLSRYVNRENAFEVFCKANDLALATPLARLLYA